MNEDYLKGLHEYLGIKDDYNTWVNAVKDNDKYLAGLHDYLKIKDDVNTWKSKVWGSKSVGSTWSIQDLTLQKLQAEKSPLYREGEDLRKIKAIRYANNAINTKIQADRVNYTKKPTSSNSVISAMGELPSDRVSYSSFEKEKMIGFRERESRDKAAKEVFNSMPDFLDVATPEDIELAKYGEDYVKSRNKEAGILAIKQAKNQKEYDKILAADNIILDDNINLAELSARNTLKNLVNFVSPTAPIIDAQVMQEFALQDKQEAAAYDRYMINRESAKIGEYLEYVGNEVDNREAQVRGDLHQKGWDWDQYKELVTKLNKGEKLPEENIQQVAIIQNYLKSSDIFKKFNDLNTKMIGVYDEFNALPVTYKQGAIVNKLERQVADKFTKDYASMDGALQAVSFVNNTFIGGIERNFIRRPISTVVGLAALAGMDSAIAQEIELAGESQQGTFGRKASRFMRPTHEKVGEIFIKGNKYEVGFDERRKMTDIYDINGDAQNLEKLFGKEEYQQDLEDALASQNVYDNAKWDINWKAIGSTVLDTSIDVGATFLGTVGFAKALQGAAALSEISGLTNAANVFTKLSKSERLLEFVPMYAQYYGEGVLNGIRSGKMTVQDAALMSVLSTAAEAGSEALPFPMIGKLATGGKKATSKLIAGVTDGNFMAALSKLPTRYARTQALGGFVALLLYETGEEVAIEYATPMLNQLANTLLDAKFENLDLPTARDLRDLSIITMGATIIPGAMRSMQIYDYFKSDDFVKHSLFKALDPKNKELTDAFLKEMVGSNKLTQPEVDNFNNLRNKLSESYAALIDQGANNKEANSLREDIIGLEAFITMEKSKLGTNELLNEGVQKKIDAAQKELEVKIQKLKDTEKIPSEDVQSEGLPDIATNQDNKGKSGDIMGEDNISLAQSTQQTDIEKRRKETEGKIKRKDLFSDGGVFANELGGSGINSVPTNHRQINDIEFVEFSNPNTGIVDVIMTGTSDSDFVGYYRLYENGKPTNKWSSKFENKSRNKENFKTMIRGVQEMLPQGHEYTEKTSISTDGLRVWAQQLSRDYELQYDNNGDLITNTVAINGGAIVNELGINVNQDNFDNISVTNKEQFESVKKALLPYLQKFGLNENNIYWINGTVEIDLPVLKSNKINAKYEAERKALEQTKPIKDDTNNTISDAVT